MSISPLSFHADILCFLVGSRKPMLKPPPAQPGTAEATASRMCIWMTSLTIGRGPDCADPSAGRPLCKTWNWTLTNYRSTTTTRCRESERRQLSMGYDSPSQTPCPFATAA